MENIKNRFAKNEKLGKDERLIIENPETKLFQQKEHRWLLVKEEWVGTKLGLSNEEIGVLKIKNLFVL